METGALPGDIETRIATIVAAHEGLEGPLLPILHAVQEELGHVPDAVLPHIASALNLSRAEVYGVRTFYPDFRDAPTGRHVIKLCRAEACQSVGGRELAAALKDKLGIDWGETTPDGLVTLEPVYCLGLCSCAPAAEFDGKLKARLDETKIDTLIGEFDR